MGAGGRPRKYNSAEEVQELIEKYFNSCFEDAYIVKDGKVIILKDAKGNPIKRQFKPFTVTGLANALDMSRETLLQYGKEEEFSDTIMKAKRMCEIYAEERLYDRDGNRGAIFSLSNNFKSWNDKQQIEMTKEPTLNININNNDSLKEAFYEKEEQE